MVYVLLSWSSSVSHARDALCSTMFKECCIAYNHAATAVVKKTTALRLGGYPFVGNSEMAPFFWLAPGGANFLLCLLSRRHCCSAYLLSKTQEVLFWPCLSVRSTPFTCLERAQRRENCSRGSADRFFLQRDWLHLLNSAPKRVLSWQVFEQQISAC